MKKTFRLKRFQDQIGIIALLSVICTITISVKVLCERTSDAEKIIFLFCYLSLVIANLSAIDEKPLGVFFGKDGESNFIPLMRGWFTSYVFCGPLFYGIFKTNTELDSEQIYSVIGIVALFIGMLVMLIHFLNEKKEPT